jgi:neutral ceramidase
MPEYKLTNNHPGRRVFLRSLMASVAGAWLSTDPRSLLAAPPPWEWKAGLAKVPITPRGPLWMAGYASRKKPSEGVAQELYAKALALEDHSGKRAVLVTTDLLGLPAVVSREIAERAEKRYHLGRDRLLLSSSHTHGGPVLDGMLKIAYSMNAQQSADVEAYTGELKDKIVNLVGAALKALKPAQLSLSHGEAGFGMNRRAVTNEQRVIGVNPKGPVDHDVPVLRVEDQHGRLRAVIFGYACHNTTARDFLEFHGDYAGFAQAQLENHHPGAMALFIAGCGADANPYPRGTLELARQHGEELAAAVEKVLGGTFQPVRGPLTTAYEEFPVAFAPPPGREALQAQLQGGDAYHRKWAEAMLRILDRDGHLPTTYPYPLEVWQFGRDLTLIALAGEVVVDYDLRLKKELGAGKLWVAGYCNDVFAYIPSLRVLQEGGYEGGGAMIYYGQPGPFAPSIEETIISKVHGLLQRVRNEGSSHTSGLSRSERERFAMNALLREAP